MLVTGASIHPLQRHPLDPCIRQRFTFLEMRAAAIITGWIYLKAALISAHATVVSVHSLYAHHIDVEIEQFPLPQGTQRIIYPG